MQSTHSAVDSSLSRVFWSEQKWLACVFGINRAEFQEPEKGNKQRKQQTCF